MKKGIAVLPVLAAVFFLTGTAGARLKYVPPAAFGRVVIEPVGLTTNQMERFAVSVEVSPVSNSAGIRSVKAGLAIDPDSMQAVSFVPVSNRVVEVVTVTAESGSVSNVARTPFEIWQGEIELPHEDLENGVFLVTAVLETNAYYPKAVSFSTNFNVFPGYNANNRRAIRWSSVMDVVFLGVLLMIATFLRRKVKFFQKFLVPPSMIAGFLGIIVGPSVLNLVKFSPDRLGNLVYHLMAVGFIAMSLMNPDKADKEKGGVSPYQPVNSGAVIVSYYLLQGVIGFTVTLILAYTLLPKLFPPFGMLLPLGYGQGPGIAYTMGSSWEKSGFLYGGNIGMTIATFGFIWACFIGVPLMNILLRRGKMKPASSVYGKSVRDERKLTGDLLKDKEGDVPLSESVDRLSIQIFLIAIVYLMTYVFLFGFEKLMDAIAKAAPGFASIGSTFSNMFWGFFFIFGSLFGMLVRHSFKWFKNKQWMSRNYPNDYLLQRISSGSFDFLVTASIAAISVPVFLDNALAILVLTTAGGFATLFYIVWLSKWVYKKYTLEYTLAMFGMATGTISTGLALLKEIDPTFETPAAKDMVFGSGTAVGFGFPLMMLLALPVIGYSQQKPVLYLWTMIAMIVMWALLLWLLAVNVRRRDRKIALLENGPGKKTGETEKSGGGKKKKK